MSSPSNDVCRICMHEVSDATSVKGCSHVFCYHCLHQWTSTRRAPLCPICRTAITTFVLADGTEQAAEPSTSAPSDEPDLSCLDHAYFLAEVSRLLSRANAVHNRLYAEAYGCGRKGGGRQTERGLDSIQDVMGVLSSYRSSLQDEVRFDAEVLLQDLYRLDRQLTSISSGSSASDTAADVEGDVEHWCEDDFHDEHDYCWHEEDDDEHDWHEGLHKTPGRAPPQRHVTRHVRTGSGQQQQQRLQQQRVQGRGR